jgi:very-short-patch-repair endonuclease
VSAINGIVSVDRVELAPVDAISGEPVYRVVLRRSGVAGASKNIIFAAIGPKPEIIIRDAINNDIEIVKHEDKCLVYASPVPASGLTWGVLVDWWAALTECADDRKQVAKNLSLRLQQSLASQAERNLFRAYNRSAWARREWDMPALIPQVYLHYDPYTARLRDQLKVVSRQRMDFLLLISPRERIVVEVDGVHHYSTDERPDTRKYAEMVAEDRALRLLGYEVFRFGGAELMDSAGSETIVGEFVDRLFSGTTSL